MVISDFKRIHIGKNSKAVDPAARAQERAVCVLTKASGKRTLFVHIRKHVSNDAGLSQGLEPLD
jgi:hypothetical protein